MQRITARYAALLALAGAVVACGDSGTDPEPEAAFIELTSEIDVLPAGQSWELQTVVEDEDGDVITNPDVGYATSNTSIATVDDEGVVTGVGDGIVTITAVADGVSDEVEIGIFDIGDLCTNALGIDLGESVRASLQPGDCDEIVDDGSFVDLWFFDLAQTSTVTIDLESDDFDAYMWLIDDAGADVDEDDDGGGGTDSRIIATLAPGTYFILANHYPPEFGAYEITVTASTTASPSQAAIGLQKVRSVGTLPALRLKTP